MSVEALMDHQAALILDKWMKCSFFKISFAWESKRQTALSPLRPSGNFVRMPKGVPWI